jgi:plasmid stabilization system protein ParE
MFTFVLSPEALQDLQDVWDYIAADNATAADALEDKFFEAFEQLGRRPRIGHLRADLTNRDVRFWLVESYLIVYRIIPKMIQIVAVLHGARDIPEIIQRRHID